MRVLFFYLLLLLGPPGPETRVKGAAQAQVPTPGSNTQTSPDLNLLRQRVSDYWGLLQEGRKREALVYVDASTQDTFLSRRELSFSCFVIRGIRFETRPDIVVVTVGAVVLPIGFVRTVEWPVEEQWIFRDRSWYVQSEATRFKELFGSRGPRAATGLNAEEARREEIAQGLDRFTVMEHLNLGEVSQGDIIWRQIPLRNESRGIVSVRVTEAPDWTAFDKIDFQVSPESVGMLGLNGFTAELEGKITGTISLVLSLGRAEAARGISLEGYVRAPLSITPRRILLDDSSTREILVQNNTEREIQIKQVVSSAKFLKLDLPPDKAKKIVPGGRLSPKVEWNKRQFPPDWSAGSIELELAEAVDGRSLFRISVLRSP